MRRDTAEAKCEKLTEQLSTLETALQAATARALSIQAEYDSLHSAHTALERSAEQARAAHEAAAASSAKHPADQEARLTAELPRHSELELPLIPIRRSRPT